MLLTEIAWSLPQFESDRHNTCLIAAGASNGTVVVWHAEDLLNETAPAPAPEAILDKHSRQVNRLAWNQTGRQNGWLITGSQDATVRLWERKSSASDVTGQQSGGVRSWFGVHDSPSLSNRPHSWKCRATFEPKAEAVRDIKWSPFLDDGKSRCCCDTNNAIFYFFAPRSYLHDGHVVIWKVRVLSIRVYSQTSCFGRVSHAPSIE